ncbi:putative FecR [Novosphingobium resinovorum]|uniref:Putative FecR n=1 Tax=Novosphingobium resinovorum TaxID=158500 RepID=A0A031K4P5_9SPHN|nr:MULTISPECIES: FecR domain-containing protein [Novosphingobium]EZP83988.1 putative FecR [Novosphingobium resinovorum]
MTDGADSEYPVDEIARAWLTKMRGEEANALRAEFEAWRAAAAENREAYARISTRMAASAVLKTSARHGAARPKSGARSQSRGWAPWGAMTAAAALLLVAYGAGGASVPGFLSGGASSARAAERFATKRGEIRRFQLPGSSVATLDTDSQLLVSFTGSEQHVRLDRGRVRLAITGAAHPVRIHIGKQQMIASDADFDLSLDADGRVRIALLRGVARIVDAGARGESFSALPLGKTLALQSRGAARVVIPAADSGARDWPSGWTEHRSISLGDLVAEANRYAIRPIIIDERAVAALTVSGRFKISDAEAFASRTAKLFGLTLVERQDGLHLRSQ